jgi:hypothetical protein
MAGFKNALGPPAGLAGLISVSLGWDSAVFEQSQSAGLTELPKFRSIKLTIVVH